MNLRSLLLAPFSLFVVPVLLAQADNVPPTPPPVSLGMPRAATPAAQVGPQRVYGPTGETLIAREAAAGILERFRKTNATDAAPRVVIYVNRALVDTATGLKLTGHTEKYYKEGDTVSKTSGENTYAVKDAPAFTLADQQTVREVERLFGRAFRGGGATLADQKSAAALLEDNPGHRLVGDQAAKDREALAKIADVAIEVLISSRNLTVAEIAGDKTYTVPDIQATAIRLKDSAIIGQAAASDILGRDQQAGRVVRQFDVRDITEATALALMEDMVSGKKE